MRAMRQRKQETKPRVNVRSMVPENIPHELVVYHSYILTNNFKLNFPLLDEDTIIRLNHYFAEAGLFYPWHCKQIIDYCRENKRKVIKKECKKIFPEMFTWGSGQNPVAVPTILENWNVVELSVLEREVENFKENIMNNNEVSVERVENTNPQTNETQNTQFLTLENYREVTGKRFRMTKAENALVKDGVETRESIFNRRRDNGQLDV